MKKTIYLTVITLLTVICVLIGLWGSFDFGGGKETSETIVLEAFESIDVDADAMTLSICAQGTDYVLSYECSEKQSLAWDVSQGVLSLSGQSSSDGWFGLHNTNPCCSVTLIVPEGTSLEKIDVVVAVGDLSFEKISAQECELEANVGDVDLNGCTMEQLTITANVGDIEIGSSLDLSGYEMQLECDLGEISINGSDYAHAYQTRGNAGAISVTANWGDIEITY